MYFKNWSPACTGVSKLVWTALLAVLMSAPTLAIEVPASKDVATWTTAIANGLDVDTTEVDGTTVLMRAIHERNTELAALLIINGADITRSNRYGITALNLAARTGSADITRLLLAAGVDANSINTEGETALMTAAGNGHVEVIKLLLAGTDTGGNTLLSRPADPNILDGWKGQTALMWAAAHGYTEAAIALIDGGADVNLRSSVINIAPVDPEYFQGGFVYTDVPKGRMTALHFAAREGKLDTVQALLAHGSDPNIVDDDSTSAAIIAILNGHLEIARILLEAGTDPNLVDRWGRTVVFVATDLNTMDANPRPTPKILGTTSPVDIVKLALAKGANPNLPLKKGLPNWLVVGGTHNPILQEGATAFFRACMSGDIELQRILLAAGADPKLNTTERPGKETAGMLIPTNGGTTPLMVAAGLSWRTGLSRGREQDAIATMTMLLDEFGADINAANQSGDTALHGAVMKGSLAIVEFLLARGANLDAINAKKLRPLDIAMGQPGLGIVANPTLVELLSSKQNN